MFSRWLSTCTSRSRRANRQRRRSPGRAKGRGGPTEPQEPDRACGRRSLRGMEPRLTRLELRVEKRDSHRSRSRQQCRRHHRGHHAGAKLRGLECRRSGSSAASRSKATVTNLAAALHGGFCIAVAKTAGCASIASTGHRAGELWCSCRRRLPHSRSAPPGPAASGPRDAVFNLGRGCRVGARLLQGKIARWSPAPWTPAASARRARAYPYLDDTIAAASRPVRWGPR